MAEKKDYRLEKREVPKGSGNFQHYCYLRVIGLPATRLPLPWEPTFQAELKLAMTQGKVVEVKNERTLEGIIRRYRMDPLFTKCAPKTREMYELTFKKLTPYYSREMKDVDRDALIELRNTVAGKSSFNNVLTNLKTLFGYARDNKLMATDDIPNLKGLKHDDTGHWGTWEPEDIQKFLAVPNIPDVVRMGFLLCLYTGQRIGDVLRMTWDQVTDDGLIEVVQGKTGDYAPVPVHPVLEQALAWRRGLGLNHKRLVPLDIAQPWREGMSLDEQHDYWHRVYQAFSGRFTKVKWLAGLPDGHPIHGLRKTAACMLYLAGCEVEEIMAITGHDSYDVLKIYIAKARTRRMARRGMAKVVADEDGDYADVHKAALAGVGATPAKTNVVELVAQAA